MTLFTALTVFALISASFTSPTAQFRNTKRSVTRLSQGKQSTGNFIVGHSPSSSRKAIISSPSIPLSEQDIKKELAHLHAFVVKANDSSLDSLLNHSDVTYVEEEGYVEIDSVQTDATWGLSRISSSSKINSSDANALNFTYTYNDSAGNGVDAYVIDTGVRITHEQFEGRASWGAAFPDTLSLDDQNGHGTHVAGTIAGKQFGVAKKANIIAVRVLNGRGSGEASDALAGLDWVISQVKASGRPSIASMSLRYETSAAFDDAIKKLTDAGIHAVASAGNAAMDASTQSPGRAPEAITVGASDINDEMVDYSNFGPLVDILAPGENVISAWLTNDTATHVDSGTSMATPHISGLVATLISKDGNVSPAEMQQKVKDMAQKGVLTGIPDNTTNVLANNGA